MNQDDVMLRLALIATFHSNKKKIARLVMDVAQRVPRSNRGPLYTIIGSYDPVAVILEALRNYEV